VSTAVFESLTSTEASRKSAAGIVPAQEAAETRYLTHVRLGLSGGNWMLHV